MSDCVEWTGTTNDRGYPITWKKPNRGRKVHHVIFEEYKGPIPKGMMVRHLCHNKLCINPDHLEIGTAKDNRADDIKNNPKWPWNPIGSQSPNAKLDEDIVKEIKKELKNYKRGDFKRLGQKYNVDPSIISRIKNGTAWKHLQE